MVICQGKPNDDYEYSKSPYLFWRCKWGMGTLHKCPLEHSFDTNAHLCVPFGNSSLCDGRMHVPHPDDPHKFYKCAHGIAFEFTCPNLLIFDDKLSVCTWGSGPKTTIATTKVTVFNPNSKCVNPPFYLVAHPDKHKYISCVHGIGYVMSCPRPLVFDDANHYCNWA
uniref:chitinase n=1 Tax=Eptatretus burgeri TaxID=7764 RepID=A0A8C4WW39_EPTBU